MDPTGHAPISEGGSGTPGSQELDEGEAEHQDNLDKTQWCIDNNDECKAQDEEAEAEQKAQQQAQQQAQRDSQIQTAANVVYNETGGIEATALADTVALHEARVGEATVFYHHPGNFHHERRLTKAQKEKIASDPHAEAVMADAKSAATEAYGAPDNGNHAIIYDPRLNKPHVDWMNFAYVTHINGPFTNQAGGGDVKRGDPAYIVIMQDMTYRERLVVH